MSGDDKRSIRHCCPCQPLDTLTNNTGTYALLERCKKLPGGSAAKQSLVEGMCEVDAEEASSKCIFVSLSTDSDYKNHIKYQQHYFKS